MDTVGAVLLDPVEDLFRPDPAAPAAEVADAGTAEVIDPFTGLPMRLRTRPTPIDLGVVEGSADSDTAMPTHSDAFPAPGSAAAESSASSCSSAEAWPACGPMGVGGEDGAARPPVHPAVAQLQSSIASVVRAQAAGELAVGSLVDTAALLRAAESVAGLALVELAAVDRTKAYLGVGRASAAGWVGATLTITEAAARAKVALARRLTEDLARVGDLLVDGGTTVGHCQAMTTGLRGIRPEVVAESVPALVVLARSLDPTSLARELRERAHAVSEDLAEEQERRQRQRTGLAATELLDGCVSIHGLLAPEPGQALLAALDAQVHGDRQARDEDGEPDDRDAPTRRADALGALAQHALGCDGLLPGHGGSRATVHVIVTEENLTEQPGATPATFAGSNALLTRQQLLRLSCDADISRITLDDTRRRGSTGSAAGTPRSPDSDGTQTRASRRVLDLGRLTRTVNAAQHRALVARDRGCVIKGCRRRPSQCQAHHVWHWSLGGPSDLANYALVCHLHHHQLHEGGKTLQHDDGRWLTPTGYTDTGPPGT